MFSFEYHENESDLYSEDNGKHPKIKSRTKVFGSVLWRNNWYLCGRWTGEKQEPKANLNVQGRDFTTLGVPAAAAKRGKLIWWYLGIGDGCI